MVKLGRPLKYTEEYLNDLAIKLLDWIKVQSNWWLMDFAIENDLYAQQLTEFSAKNESFYLALKKAKTIQESRIVKLAMVRKIDTTMAIFTLKNIAGWRDKQREPEDDELKDSTLRFPEVPENGDIAERYKRFIN